MTCKRAVAVAGVLTLLGGCVRRERVLPAFVFADHQADLASGKPVDVAPPGDPPVVMRASDPIEIVTIDGAHHALHVADVITGCPPVAPGSSDLCGRPVDRVVYGHERVLAPVVKDIAVYAVGLGALGGAIYCTAECGSPYQYVSGGLLVVTALVGVGLVYVAAALVPRN